MNKDKQIYIFNMNLIQYCFNIDTTDNNIKYSYSQLHINMLFFVALFILQKRNIVLFLRPLIELYQKHVKQNYS
ncbi:hypothetical protein IE90_10145 [Sanguibacteroides justesenii]|uniref:Transmembrane protein n=1 Tax=Sanguibacteroides justesenii TaxID=1547597 RepID=A0AB34R104_9PORP|nr:hypothetical protein IE90_10145 [Sanguibacteroides justesenii]